MPSERTKTVTRAAVGSVSEGTASTTAASGRPPEGADEAKRMTTVPQPPGAPGRRLKELSLSLGPFGAPAPPPPPKPARPASSPVQ